jgi:hypothetical protein
VIGKLLLGAGLPNKPTGTAAIGRRTRTVTMPLLSWSVARVAAVLGEIVGKLQGLLSSLTLATV